MSSDESKPHSPIATIPNHVEGALSLFTPQLQAESGILMLHESRDTHIALEEVQVSPASNNLAMDRLTQGVSGDSSSEYVVVFTGDAPGSDSKAVIGAYISFPPPAMGTTAAVHASRRIIRRILFQLQPEFRLLWGGTRSDLGSLTQMESETSHIADSPDMPYWVGNPSGRDAGLKVDPQRKTVTFTRGDARSDVESDLMVRQARMDIFTLGHGVNHKSED